MKIHPILEELTTNFSRMELLLILNRLFDQHSSGVLVTIEQYQNEKDASKTISNLLHYIPNNEG